LPVSLRLGKNWRVVKRFGAKKQGVKKYLSEAQNSEVFQKRRIQQEQAKKPLPSHRMQGTQGAKTMKRKLTTIWAISGALAGVAAWGSANGVAARAQNFPPPPQNGGPGGFGGGRPQQGGPGGGRGGFGGGQQGGPGGGRQGRGGPAPFANGIITALDASAGRITLRAQQGEQSQIVEVASGTPIVSQVTVTVADLQVGDQVQVQGMPTEITASALTIGQMPPGFGGGPGGFGGPGGGGQGGPPGGGGPGGQGGPGGRPQGGPPAFASATGKVTSTSPLTIALSGDVSVTLKLASNAKITRIKTVDLSSLKVGDRITAMGQANNDGAFAATSVGVNIEMGGGGRGGRGGGPGGGGPGGGFGGPGGRGGGPGGGFGGPPPGGPDGPPPPPEAE